jgi:hypothetical protein
MKLEDEEYDEGPEKEEIHSFEQDSEKKISGHKRARDEQTLDDKKSTIPTSMEEFEDTYLLPNTSQVPDRNFICEEAFLDRLKKPCDQLS